MCGTLSECNLQKLKHLPPRMGLLHYNPSLQILHSWKLYRGITIQLVISQLYNIVLMTRMEWWAAIDNNLIPDAQFGFSNHSLYTCFLDFCEAFDRVCQNWKEQWPIVRSRPDPNKKWRETRMPIQPTTITFYFGHSQTGRYTGIIPGTSQMNSLLLAIRLQW